MGNPTPRRPLMEEDIGTMPAWPTNWAPSETRWFEVFAIDVIRVPRAIIGMAAITPVMFICASMSVMFTTTTVIMTSPITMTRAMTMIHRIITTGRGDAPVGCTTMLLSTKGWEKSGGYSVSYFRLWNITPQQFAVARRRQLFWRVQCCFGCSPGSVPTLELAFSVAPHRQQTKSHLAVYWTN